MNKKEIKNFEIISYIVDNRKVVSLKKREDLEVRWKGKFGKAEKEIIFEKDGKTYKVFVEVLLEKYLWGTRDTIARDKIFVPPNVDYQKYKGNPPPKGYEYSDEGVKLTSQWRADKLFIIFFSVSAFIIIFYFFWKLLEKYQKSFVLLFSVPCLIIIGLLIKVNFR